jgi:hypothetical protein
MDGHGTAPTATRASWIAFVLWALIGAVIGYVAVNLLTAGVLLVVLIVLALVAKPSVRQQISGVLAGVGAICLLVAYVQRRGPGTVCWHTANAGGCDQYLNPWPWLAAGLALIAFSVVVFTRSLRER